MAQQLRDAGFRWEFVDGIRGRALGDFPVGYDRRRRLQYYGYDLSWGELGCLLSHRKAWARVVELKEVCLVLEDDVTLLPNYPAVERIALDLFDRWDLFRLHSGQEKWPVRLVHRSEHLVFENLGDPGSAAAFLIKPSAAKRLLEDSQSFFMMNDDFIESRFIHHQRILAICPYPFEAGWGDSTISDRRLPLLNSLKRLRREIYRIPYGLRRAFWQGSRWTALILMRLIPGWIARLPTTRH